ncbi:MAG TPA: carboxypeptidase-like regulatory domain-containing protein [Acidobacteriaceae bacterium]
MRHWSLLLLPVLTIAAPAQNSSAKSATGTVTGHVYCADTNAPARMARVQLESFRDAEQRTASHPSPSSDGPIGGIVQTALDGSFVIPDVPAGHYYVVATASGYLSPRANAGDISEAEPPAAAGQPAVAIPKVDIQADQSAAVDIRLERGAAVNGTIRFDDGSPAIGIHVAVMRKGKDKEAPSNSTDVGIPGNETTDDLGRYRISGLRDGEYVLETLVVHLDLMPGPSRSAGLSGMMRSTLMVYSGDATRKSDAAPFKLTLGEERTGEDITIPLSKLHYVNGLVTAARDGHPINSGNLDIRGPGDNEPVVDAEIGSDGTFHLESVPEGTYILRVHNPRDSQVEEISLGGPHPMTYSDEKTLHQYGDLEQPIKVEGDIPNLVLAVPEQKSSAAAASQ